jgi:hypothetical protein
MPRAREWIRALLFGLTWAAVMEAVGVIIGGESFRLARVLASAPVWAWLSLFLAGRRAAGACPRAAS